MAGAEVELEMLFILGSMSCFVLLLPVIGFNLSSILFLYSLSCAETMAGSRAWSFPPWLRRSCSSLFAQGFATPLPVNMFGF